MKRRICVILMAVLMIMGVTVMSAAAANTYNSQPIAFSDWSNAAFGGWEERADGTLVPTELNDYVMLRLEKDLGNEYTVELDVKQEDTTSGWQTIQIGFEVNPGENFTQSGLTLDLHNAGVARVISLPNAGAGAGVVGSYDNPFGGNAGYNATTNWVHVKIHRAGSDFTVTVHDGEEKTISFTTDAYNGGYLVLGAVGSRMVSYKNVVVQCPWDVPPTDPTPAATDPTPAATDPTPAATDPTQGSDTPTAAPTQGSTPTTPQDDPAKTGDGSELLLPVMLLLAACAGMIGLLAANKKKTNQ